jgi:hypothetical protein
MIPACLAMGWAEQKLCSHSLKVLLILNLIKAYEAMVFLHVGVRYLENRVYEGYYAW